MRAFAGTHKGKCSRYAHLMRTGLVKMTMPGIVLDPNDINSPMLDYWLNINRKCVHTVGHKTKRGEGEDRAGRKNMPMEIKTSRPETLLIIRKALLSPFICNQIEGSSIYKFKRYSTLSMFSYLIREWPRI